jgi:phosphonate C-P lyase system protein PhnK
MTLNERGAATPLIQADTLTRVFRSPRRRLFQPRTRIEAVSDVTLTVTEGESVAIVGESGSGKTTLLRMLLALDSPTSGTVHFDGRAVLANPRDRMLWLRRQTGVVFQDPFTSLNPRMRIGAIVAEPLEALSVDGNHAQMVRDMLDRVELPSNSVDRYPREFSGGQRQRIALARALVHQPRLLVGDEPVSALDVGVRSRILDLLAELTRELNLTVLTVTHDLTVVRSVAQTVFVMREGRFVESGSTDQILQSPKHEYTQQLIAAVPRIRD